MKKHGIYIEKGKKTQTKKIYNNGYLIIRYFFQPHHLNFKSEMVNDMNQHFAGGWSLNDLDLSDEALLKRVLDGKKTDCHNFKMEHGRIKKILLKN